MSDKQKNIILICSFVLILGFGFLTYHWFLNRHKEFVQSLIDQSGALEPLAAFMSQWYPTYKIDADVTHATLMDVLDFEASSDIQFTCHVQFYSGSLDRWESVASTAPSLSKACSDVKKQLSQQIPHPP